MSRHDDSRFPLVVVRFSPDADAHRIDMTFLRTCIARGRFGFVGDCSSITSMPTASQRPIMYANSKELVASIAGTCVHNALVITHPMMRATLAAIMWAVTTPYPVTVHATLAEAAAAAERALAAKKTA